MPARFFIVIWLVALLLKLALAAWLPLFADEAYYWVWSHHLQWSYYDHPAFIAWLIRLGHGFEGFANLVRWPAVLFAHCTFWVWYHLLKDHLPQVRLRWWATLTLITPMTGLGSIILTPDLPLIFFWSLSLLAMSKLIYQPQRRWYFLLGLSLGLGACAKYHIVLFLPCLFYWLTRYRLWSALRWRWVLLSLAVALICSAPVWGWNLANDFVSFKFQLQHGLGATVWKAKWTTRYLYSQTLLIFPLILWGALRSKPPTKLSWLPIFAWFPVLFFLLTSFKGKVEANWPAPAYPSLLALACLAPISLAALRTTFASWVAVALVVITHIHSPWVPWFDHKRLKTYELVKYQPLTAVALAYQPFYASTYQMAAKIWYETKKPTYKLNGFGRRDFFDEQSASVPHEKNYFWVAEKWDNLASWAQDAGHHVVNTYPMHDNYALFEVKAP